MGDGDDYRKFYDDENRIKAEEANLVNSVKDTIRKVFEGGEQKNMIYLGEPSNRDADLNVLNRESQIILEDPSLNLSQISFSYDESSKMIVAFVEFKSDLR